MEPSPYLATVFAEPPSEPLAGPSWLSDVAPAQGRYERLADLGAGNAGRVVRALDTHLGRVIARKELERRDETPRFVQEASLLAQFDHPHILPVYDIGLESGQPYYTMPCLEEVEPLDAVIARLRAGDAETAARYPLERRVELVLSLCRAVGYAHARGVVHRDIKPANVLVASDGRAYLIDWGVAVVLESAEGMRRPSGPVSSGVSGTPAYMAPEQFLGEATPQVDVFGLCALLFELLTGEHYLGEALLSCGGLEDVQALQEGASERAARRANALGLSFLLVRACTRGLAQDPARRHASTQVLEDELRAWLHSDPEVVCGATLTMRLLHTWQRALEGRFHRPLMWLTISGPALLVFAGVALGWQLARGY